MNIYYRSATVEDAAAIANVETISIQYAYQEFMPASYLEKLDVPDKTERWKMHCSPRRMIALSSQYTMKQSSVLSEPESAAKRT